MKGKEGGEGLREEERKWRRRGRREGEEGLRVDELGGWSRFE